MFGEIRQYKLSELMEHPEQLDDFLALGGRFFPDDRQADLSGKKAPEANSLQQGVVVMVKMPFRSRHLNPFMVFDRHDRTEDPEHGPKLRFVVYNSQGFPLCIVITRQATYNVMRQTYDIVPVGISDRLRSACDRRAMPLKAAFLWLLDRDAEYGRDAAPATAFPQPAASVLPRGAGMSSGVAVLSFAGAGAGAGAGMSSGVAVPSFAGPGAGAGAGMSSGVAVPSFAGAGAGAGAGTGTSGKAAVPSFRFPTYGAAVLASKTLKRDRSEEEEVADVPSASRVRTDDDTHPPAGPIEIPDGFFMKHYYGHEEFKDEVEKLGLGNLLGPMKNL
jgi:hypothetical protein